MKRLQFTPIVHNQTNAETQRQEHYASMGAAFCHERIKPERVYALPAASRAQPELLCCFITHDLNSLSTKYFMLCLHNVGFSPK
jgi:hypothetical protein